MIQRFYTTEAQSDELLRCGLDPNTADMYYDRNGSHYPAPNMRYDDSSPIDVNHTPCWTASKLYELLPEMLNNEPMQSLYATKYDDRYKVAYGYMHHDMINVESGNQADLYFSMMTWILENNYIKNEQGCRDVIQDISVE
jgi:hypothetical protein